VRSDVDGCFWHQYEVHRRRDLGPFTAA